MDRYQILAKLQRTAQLLQQSVQRIQTLPNGESPSLELALVEKQLVSIYEDIQLFKMEGRMPAQPPTSVPQVVDSTDEKSPTSVEPLVSVPSPVAKQETEAPFLEEEQLDEKTDAELDHLMNIAEEEHARIAPPTAIDHVEVKQDVPEPGQPTQKVVAEASRETVQTEQKIETPTTAAEPTVHVPEPTSVDEEKKPTSINQRHSTDQSATSLHQKLASRRDPNKQVSAQFKGKPIKDLKKAINLNLQIRFTKELFEGDKRAFKRTVDFLNKCNTFSEARSYLQVEGVNKYEWDEASRHYQDLLGIVKRKFI